MVVRVQTILDLVPLLGGSQVQLELPGEDVSVRRVLDVLVDRRGEELRRKLFNPVDGQLYGHLRLLLNGRDIAFAGGLEAPVHDGDTLMIIPPAAGG